MSLPAPDLDLVRGVGIFADLEDAALRELAGALTGEHLAAGVEVFTKGSPGDSLYLLASGRVRVHDGDRSLDELGPGDVFGELALIDGEPRSASVTTVEPCLLYRLERAVFDRLLHERLGFAPAIIRVLSRRLRSRLRDIADDARYIAQLYQASREHDRLSADLQLAAKVQEGFLPTRLPSPEGWELAAAWRPAREVSGDFYDVFGDGTTDVVIADVADKGMSAALFMAIARSALRSSLGDGLPLARGVAGANRLLSADAVDGMFVTLFAARLTAAGGEVAFVNAGHNPPLLHRAAGGSCSVLPRTGLPLAWDEDVPYQQGSVTLEPGDVLLLYTDGVSEAFDPDGEAYGEARLERLLRGVATRAPAEVVAALLADLERFRRGAPPHDDVTVVVVRRS